MEENPYKSPAHVGHERTVPVIEEMEAIDEPSAGHVLVVFLLMLGLVIGAIVLR